MDILEDQCMFSILEAEIEDCEISLVEGVLLCNTKRIASLVVLRNDVRVILQTPSCSWLWLQGRTLQVLCCCVI